MPNHPLAAAMAAAGLTEQQLADELGVPGQVVRQWLRGRRPRLEDRRAIARLLDRDEVYLWPEGTQHESDPDLITVHAQRGLVPDTTWAELITMARESIDVLAYSGLSLIDPHPELVSAVAELSSAGVRVRAILGDPDSAAVGRRAEEEQLGDTLATRIRLALADIAPFLPTSGALVRLHDTTLYNAIVRVDERMLVNLQAYGLSARAAPVLELERSSNGRLFDFYAQSFERVWEQGVPIEESPYGASRLS